MLALLVFEVKLLLVMAFIGVVEHSSNQTLEVVGVGCRLERQDV